MKIEYDQDVDAAYIYLEYPIKDGEVKQTVELNENLVLDLDNNGKILGIEILDASKVLHKKAIIEAQKTIKGYRFIS